MRTKRKRKLWFILISTIGSAIAVIFVLQALRENIDLYYTPQQAMQAHLNVEQHFRLGGLVKKNSLQQTTNTLTINFDITDFTQTISVAYQGVLPSLFREGQGIIAEGHFNARGIFIADRVLAKHGANYHPPGVVHKGKVVR